MSFFVIPILQELKTEAETNVAVRSHRLSQGFIYDLYINLRENQYSLVIKERTFYIVN